jgi:hypothetical protein
MVCSGVYHGPTCHKTELKRWGITAPCRRGSTGGLQDIAGVSVRREVSRRAAASTADGGALIAVYCKHQRPCHLLSLRPYISK